MRRELIVIAAEEALKVYSYAQYDLGTTEFSIVKRETSKRPISVLAIRGTDEWMDWFKNFNMAETGGWKRPAYDAANKIMGHQRFIHEVGKWPPEPLLIACHSKSGPTGLRIKSLMPVRSVCCVAFEPARGLRNSHEVALKDTVIVKDPDSFVHKVGWSRFKHPECETMRLADDKWWPSIGDHGMKHCLESVR